MPPLTCGPGLLPTVPLAAVLGPSHRFPPQCQQAASPGPAGLSWAQRVPSVFSCCVPRQLCGVEFRAVASLLDRLLLQNLKLGVKSEKIQYFAY